MASNSGRKRIGSSSKAAAAAAGGGGVLGRVTSRVSESAIFQMGKQTASDAALVTKKLLKSTGKAAWILGTTLLIIGLPLIIELERDSQVEAMEAQQASLLGTPPPSSSKPY